MKGFLTSAKLQVKIEPSIILFKITHKIIYYIVTLFTKVHLRFFDIHIGISFPLQKGLQPPIPSELVLSFYLSGWKLILAVYHIVVDPKTNVSKFNRYQAECVIPWVNEVLLLLTVALQASQQLKDKVIIDDSIWGFINLFMFFVHFFSDKDIFSVPGFPTPILRAIEKLRLKQFLGCVEKQLSHPLTTKGCHIPPTS